MGDTNRSLVRVRRRNRAALNPDGIGDLLYDTLLAYDPECHAVVVELDAEGADELEAQAEYDVERIEGNDD
jgi:hypothetical protein